MRFIHKLLKRKLLLAIIIIILAGGGYFAYKTFNNQESAPRYLTAAVTKGTLIVSIGGTGQVSSSNQVDIKPKVSGDVIYVGVKSGQEVKTGVIIAQLDARDALKAVRDAEANIASANLSLKKIKQPADNLSILQAKNSLAQAQDNLTKLKLSQETDYQKALEAKQKAEDDLKKAYEDGYNTISNAFLDLPGLMSGLNDILFSSGDFERSQQNIDWYLNQVTTDNRAKATNYRDDAAAAYAKARTAYDKNLDDYKATSRVSDNQTIESLIAETYETTKLSADAVKTLNNYIDFVQDDMEQHNRTIPSLISTHQTNIDSYTSTANSNLLSLLSIQTTIRTSKETITNSNRDIKEMEQNNPLEFSAAQASIAEKEGSLAKLKAGADALDIQSAELTVKQRQNSLLDAREKLADYFVRAPFDGIIAQLNIKKGDAASSGAAIATLMTKQKIAEISLNEIDAAKIKVGQKATLTFDAVEGLSITGEVIAVDTLGTVTQGVVTYAAKIGFDTQDERVKSGMSVSAAIITDTRQDVLIVPNGAVKSGANGYYAEMFDQPLPQYSGNEGAASALFPRQQPVEVGIANDTASEIISGLKEGDQIVTRVITAASNQTSGQQAPSLFGAPGGNRMSR